MALLGFAGNYSKLAASLDNKKGRCLSGFMQVNPMTQLAAEIAHCWFSPSRPALLPVQPPRPPTSLPYWRSRAHILRRVPHHSLQQRLANIHKARPVHVFHGIRVRFLGDELLANPRLTTCALAFTIPHSVFFASVMRTNGVRETVERPTTCRSLPIPGRSGRLVGRDNPWKKRMNGV